MMQSGNTGDHKHVLLLQLSHALLLCFSQLCMLRTEVAPPILWILFHLFEAGSPDDKRHSEPERCGR